MPVGGFVVADGTPAAYCEPHSYLDNTAAWCVHSETSSRSGEWVLSHTTHGVARGPRHAIEWDDWVCSENSCWSEERALFTRDVRGVALGYLNNSAVVSRVKPAGIAFKRRVAVMDECPPGRFGERCEMSSVECALHRCSNRGHCTGKVYGCECDKPFWGDCSSVRCFHGVASGEKCSCTKGYTGPDCSRLDAEARCSRTGGRYLDHQHKCVCPGGRESNTTGHCPASPCGEGGRVSGFSKCKCLPDFVHEGNVTGGPCVAGTKQAHAHRSPRSEAAEALGGFFTAVTFLVLVAWSFAGVIATNIWRMRFYADPGEFSTQKGGKQL